MDLLPIQQVAVSILPLLFGITLHEVAHGYAASLFGDQTARFSGRLSLNPIRHIDLVGTIIVPIIMLLTTHFIFGWAKPVPVDPRNMRHPRRDMAIVAFVGPLSNVIMAILWGGVGKFGTVLMQHGSESIGLPLFYMGQAGILINIILAVLNLIPLPPLDGSKILGSILPPRLNYYYSLMEPYSFVILILLLITGSLGKIISPVASYLIYLVYSLLSIF